MPASVQIVNHCYSRNQRCPTIRIQLALNVDDVSAATTFYEKLFGVPAHKVRDGYANFAIEDPPLKLVLIEKPGAT